VIHDLLGSGKEDTKHEIRLCSAGSSEVYVTDLTNVAVKNKEQVCSQVLRQVINLSCYKYHLSITTNRNNDAFYFTNLLKQ